MSEPYEIDDEHLYHLAVHFLTPIKSRTARSTAKQMSRLNETTISFPGLSDRKYARKAFVALRLPHLLTLKYLQSFAEMYLHLVNVEPRVEQDLYKDHLKWSCTVAWEYKLRIPRLKHQGGSQDLVIEHVRNVKFEFERSDSNPCLYELANVQYGSESGSTSDSNAWSAVAASTLLTVAIQLAYSFSLLFSLNTRIQPAMPTPAYHAGELETSSICTESVFAPESRSDSFIIELKQGLSTVKSFARLLSLAFVELQREIKSLTWVIKQSIVLFYECSFALLVGSSYADVPLVREPANLAEDDDWQDFEWQSPFLAQPEHRSMYTPPSIVKTPSNSPTIEKKRVSFSFPSAASASVALRPPLERNRRMYETLLRHDRERAEVVGTVPEEDDSDDLSSEEGFRRHRRRVAATKTAIHAPKASSSRLSPTRKRSSPPLKSSFELQAPPESHRRASITTTLPSSRTHVPASLDESSSLPNQERALGSPALESPATDTSDAPSILFSLSGPSASSSSSRDRAHEKKKHAKTRPSGSSSKTKSKKPSSITSSNSNDSDESLSLTPETSPEVSISALPPVSPPLATTESPMKHAAFEQIAHTTATSTTSKSEKRKRRTGMGSQKEHTSSS